MMKYLYYISLFLLMVACSDDEIRSPKIPYAFIPDTAVYSPSLEGYTLVHDYSFGKLRKVKSLDDLAEYFEPYGVAGTIVINEEWQRYKPFNDRNHHFTDTTLQLIAYADGGIKAGGISSGQFATKKTFYPSDGKTLLIQLRCKIPKGTGLWPAFWMYSPGGEGTTSSEIDIFEFYNGPNLTTYDWVGGNGGKGDGADYHSIMTGEWEWTSGFDFADQYHTFTAIWKEGDVQKWVDTTFVRGSNFDWYGPAPQVIVNLALGGKPISDPKPVATPFPAIFHIDFLRIYEK